MVSHICSICTENASKYKCPSCFIRYCSVNCFKSHKQSTPSCIPDPNNHKQPHSNQTNVQQPFSDILVPNNDPVLSMAALERLRTSEKIRHLVQVPELQKVLLDLDSADKPEDMLDALMEKDGSLFNEFALEALKVTKLEAC